MPSLRETKNRIKSVKNTEKITRAMKMVAASKLRRAQEAVTRPRPYAKKLSELISALALRVELDTQSAHPLLLDRPDKKRVMVIALTSDRGLCGALNSSVVRATQRYIFDNEEKFESLVNTVGKKGYEGLSRLGLAISKRYEPESKVYDFSMAKDMAFELCEKYLAHEVDAVYLVYNQFRSAITQEVVVEQLLPVVKTSAQTQTDYIYEPEKADLLNSLVPNYFATKVYQAFLESYASEQGARMTAMDNATRNAKEMTEKLTLLYNRARQAAITKELMEIIGGAEAL
jgi:F-type H+-transporting ATPase subunit gamma